MNNSGLSIGVSPHHYRTVYSIFIIIMTYTHLKITELCENCSVFLDVLLTSLRKATKAKNRCSLLTYCRTGNAQDLLYAWIENF